MSDVETAPVDRATLVALPCPRQGSTTGGASRLRDATHTVEWALCGEDTGSLSKSARTKSGRLWKIAVLGGILRHRSKAAATWESELVWITCKALVPLPSPFIQLSLEKPFLRRLSGTSTLHIRERLVANETLSHSRAAKMVA